MCVHHGKREACFVSFSVIIPSKNAANLVSCVRAIREAGETCRIIAVDDGIDGSGPVSFTPGADLSHERVSGVKPFVFARNINIGIRAAGTDDVVLLNDDALLKDRIGFTLLQLVATDNDEYGCIGAVTNLTGQALQHPQGKGLREVPHIAFVCVYIPRRTIDKIGMLDERYCLDYGVEDRDYCEAITRAGMKVGVLDTCFVDHGSLTSTYRGHPESPKSFQRNYQLFKEKWGIA